MGQGGAKKEKSYSVALAFGVRARPCRFGSVPRPTKRRRTTREILGRHSQSGATAESAVSSLLACSGLLGVDCLRLIAQPGHREQRQDIEVFFIIAHHHEGALRREEDVIAMRDTVLLSIDHVQGKRQVTLDRRLDLVSIYFLKTIPTAKTTPRFCAFVKLTTELSDAGVRTSDRKRNRNPGVACSTLVWQIFILFRAACYPRCAIPTENSH